MAMLISGSSSLVETGSSALEQVWTDICVLLLACKNQWMGKHISGKLSCKQKPTL